MTIRRAATTLLALLPLAAQARPTDLLLGIDEQTVWGAAGPINRAGDGDAVAVLDVSDPLHPKVRASLKLVNSVFGPPTNLQITPDGALGLVASSVVTTDASGSWKAVPDDKLYVIALGDEPKLLDTLSVGRQPSGLAINRAGTLALVANRAGKSVSVLSIDGTAVKLVGEVAMGDEVAAIAIAPDGKRAFAAKNLVHKVAVLSIDGTAVSTDKAQDVPVGLGVYNLDFIDDGRILVAANTGTAGDGSAKTLSLVDAAANPPRTVDTIGVGDGPEGLAVSPDGKWAAVPLLLGSTAPHDAWSYTPNGSVALFAAEAGHLRPVQTLPVGAIPEAVAWAPDSSVFYVGNYADRDLSVFRLGAGGMAEAGRVKLPGQPASTRGPAR